MDGGDGAAGAGGGGGGGAAVVVVIVASIAGFMLVAAGVALLVASRGLAAPHDYGTADTNAGIQFEATVAAVEDGTTNLAWDAPALPHVV